MENNHSISGTIHTIAWKLLDSIRQWINHWRLHNLEFSILANDCIGGVITHNCGCRFNSPTVNLMFETEEQYICFLEHLEEYISLPVNHGILLEFYTHFRKRYIDDFNYVRWLNGHTVTVNPS